MEIEATLGAEAFGALFAAAGFGTFAPLVAHLLPVGAVVLLLL